MRKTYVILAFSIVGVTYVLSKFTAKLRSPKVKVSREMFKNKAQYLMSQRSNYSAVVFNARKPENNWANGFDATAARLLDEHYDMLARANLKLVELADHFSKKLEK